MAEHDLDALPPDPPVNPQLPALPRPAAPRRLVPVTLAAPPGLSATPDALALLRSLRRRWLMALALGCLAAVCCAAATYYAVPAKFLAAVMIRVDSRQQSGLGDHVPNHLLHTMAMKTNSERLKGKEMLIKALKEDGVRNLGLIRKHPNTTAALMWIEENLKVEYREGSELLNVQLTGEEPQDIVRIAEALTGAFIQVINGEEKRRRKDHLQRYTKLLEEAREKLREKGAEKETLSKSNKGKTAQALREDQVQNRFRLERARESALHHQFELDKKAARLAVLQRHKADLRLAPAPEIRLKDVLEADPDLPADLAKLKKYEAQVDFLRAHPDDDPILRDARRKVTALKTEVDKRVAEVRAELTAKVRQKQEADLDNGILELRTEMAPLEEHIAKYQKEAESLSKNAEEISIWTNRQNLVESEISQQEKAVGELFQAAKRAEVEVDADLPLSRIGEAEWQPRDGKKRLLMLLLAPLAALLGMVLAVAWWEFSARRIQGPDEVTAGLALRVVGAVPELPDPRRSQSGADAEAQEIYRHNLIESIDAIRTMLLRSAPNEDLRTIMVTSAVGGEGKTTLASNLAMSLARAGRKTLLIDCDLRRPTAHQLFEQTLQPGFSEVVLREVELPDAVRPTTTDPNLFLLPAGHWDREVIQELAKHGTAGIFEKVRDEFDFVVVDSHPVLPATDSLLIGQHVDAVIVSLMRDVSQAHHVHAACQQLSTLGIRVFGAVVNGVPVKDYGKGYQYTAQAVA